MKSMTFSDFTRMFDLVMSGIPLLAKIVFFVVLLFLLWDAVKGRAKLGFMEKAALVIALGIAGFGTK